jgi:hypothetical protein
VPQPSPSDVLYARPNADKSRKMCLNCGLWAEQDKVCLLLGTEIPVGGEMVCGYHCYGEPKLYGTTLGGQAMADPDLTGLITAPPGGTSCDRCKYYDPKSDQAGTCRAVQVGGQPAPVEPLGCCARWVIRDGLDLET